MYAADLTPDVSPNRHSGWFDELVHTIRTHQLQLETQAASKELADFYTVLQQGDALALAHQTRVLSQSTLIRGLLLSFMEHLVVEDVKGLLTLAASNNDSELLIWAEIADDDQALWDRIILAAAKANGVFYSYGVFIRTMVVEESDGIDTPPHYQVILSKK